MTARWQYRLRGALDESIKSSSKSDSKLCLPSTHSTLPSLLKEAGYRTALIGKWHRGLPATFQPIKSGYEEFFGPMSGGVDYFMHCSSTGEHDLYFGEQEKKEDGYLTDLLSTRAVDYAKRMATQDAPFFLSLHA
jgi:arylsulfatase A-like enzyme